jgi:threonine dehydratase
VSALVSDVIVVTGEQAMQGTLDLAEQARLWAEPAAD